MKRNFWVTVFSLLMLATSSVSRAITIQSEAGWLETAYVEFTLDANYDGYNVYVQGGQYASFTKIDAALVRKYNGYGRADALGLKAGTYTMKVVPTKSGTEQTAAAVTSGSLTVKQHDRTGFAFKGSQMPGAYNADGTLKSNAIVVYVTNDNKNSVTASITYTSKGVTQACTGLLAILTAYKKGYETRPLCIRIIGNVTDENFNFLDFLNGNAASSIDAASDYKGDVMITSNKKDLGGVTIEGIGKDAVANGWGIRLKGLNYGEVRNLGFMNCNSDEGDNIGLQQDNNYIWVHHCDMFYGNAGSDSDQVKGDGALDCKKSNYVTFSYNHFWDCGKCNLLGLSEGTKSYESSPYYITYHHNWYDHSDSRHPRCRYYNAHVYNNYYDGISKYGAGSTLGSSVFMEGNYFRNCKYPMMTSMQGSDVYKGTTTRDDKNNPTFSKEDGGVIKAYNNYMSGNYTFIPYGASSYILKGVSTSVGSIDSNADYDAYVVESATATVPSSVVSYVGSNYYSNFDTKGSMYTYTAESPEAAMATVTGEYGAGRLQHGDFSYTFSNSDDTFYDVDKTLKSALTNYTNADYVGLFSDDTSSGGGDGGEQPSTASDDATLSSLTVTGYSLSFSSSTTSYSVELAAGSTSAPQVNAVTSNAKATYVVTNASSLPGATTVTVTAEDETTTKVYTINFTVASETPSSSSISTAMTLNMGNDAYKNYIKGTYNTSTSKGSATFKGVTNEKCIKMESSTSLEFTTTQAFTMTLVAGSEENASFKVDGAVVSAEGNTVSVNLAAGSHTITKSIVVNLFFIDFALQQEDPDPGVTESDDATLKSLSVNGYTLSPAFSAATTVYSVELPVGTQTVPTVSAEANDAKATVSIDTESCIPGGQAVVKVTAENGDTKNYYINFTLNVSLTFVCNDKGQVSINGQTTANAIREMTVPEGSQTLTLTPNEGCEVMQVLINGTDVTSSVNKNVLTTTINTNSIVNVIFTNMKKGDINGDGLVNISDVTKLVDIILGKE